MFYKIFTNSEPYGKILEMQENFRNQVLNNELENGIIMFLSHTPVYTLGIRGKRENILVSDTFLEKEKIEIFNIRRGGDVTYHGPGQLVIYPILNIKKLGFVSIKEFVIWWGELISTILQENYGIKEARWDDERTGIWIKNNKIMATGLHFKHFVPIHGFALNINPNPLHFAGIIPCGITDGGVTSIKKESGLEPLISEISEIIIKKVRSTLNKEIKEYIG